MCYNYNRKEGQLLKFKEIEQISHRIVKNIDGIESLAVYEVSGKSLRLLKDMIEFWDTVFGHSALDEFGFVPLLRHGNVYLLTNENKNTVLGMASFMRDWSDPKMAYLFDYAIAEELQGMSLGYEFLTILIRDLADLGFETLQLTVDVNNKPALRLYSDKIGFNPVRMSMNEYGENEDRYIMELDIEEYLKENE